MTVDTDMAVRVWTAIEQLRHDEGNSIEIFCDNPEYTGPNSGVVWVSAETGWEPTSFDGDSVIDALEKALQYKQEMES